MTKSIAVCITAIIVIIGMFAIYQLTLGLWNAIGLPRVPN